MILCLYSEPHELGYHLSLCSREPIGQTYDKVLFIMAAPDVEFKVLLKSFARSLSSKQQSSRFHR